MEFLTINTRKRNIPKRIFFARNNILNKIKARQNSIAGYVEKLNLAGLNDDFDRDAFLKGQYNSDQNILEKEVKKSNTTSKTSRKISLFSSFRSRKSSNITQLSSLFNKKNKSSLSPAKFKTVFGNPNSPFKLDNSNSNSKKNTLIPNSNRRNRNSGLFLTLTDNDSLNYKNKYNFSTIPEHNILSPVKNIDYKFITQTDFFKTREDGVNLYRTSSDANMMIQKDGTEEIYSEAIDVENSGFTYTETDIPIEGDTDELTVQDTLEMLNELGVETDDNQNETA